MRWSRVLVPLVALAAVAAAVFLVKAPLDAFSRGYSHAYGATVVHYQLESGLLHRSLAEVAIVPRGGGRRPLLVLLHGRHDRSRLAWLIGSKSGPQSMLSDALLSALSQLGPRAPVVVLLNGGGHSYYHDRRDGRWASMILDEAIPDAVTRFGALPGRVAIGGISMGGYGALHLASLRPRAFCAAGGHSAALWLDARSTPAGAFDDAADYARNDVFAAARAGAFDRLRVWIDSGSSDPFRAADAAFAGVLRRRGDAVLYHVWPGGHAGSYWRAHMADYLSFYASALAACRR